ncbi:hypothetical protein CAP39_00485 [Sphingomonas sp. IBVSS1]|nr:hypothetical protein CAP39_00485 [Sphingomonas sp. IBVSS1]
MLLGRKRLEHCCNRGKFGRPLAASGLAVQVEIMGSKGVEFRLAVLIDGENVPAKDAGALFTQVNTLGIPIIKRVYGDFTKPGVKDWPKAISEFGGKAEQNGHTSSGKNASDIALVVDAMDFLHKRSVDGFCIVTADGDFTSFAKRAREEGFKVYCFAHSTAAKALKAACDGFFPLTKPVSTTAAAAPASSSEKPKAAQPAQAKQPRLAIAWIHDALPANPEWMTLSALGIALRQVRPTYLKQTGFASLKKLLSALNDRFEQGMGTDGKTAQVRRRKA